MISPAVKLLLIQVVLWREAPLNSLTTNFSKGNLYTVARDTPSLDPLGTNSFPPDKIEGMYYQGTSIYMLLRLDRYLVSKVATHCEEQTVTHAMEISFSFHFIICYVLILFAFQYFDFQ